MSVISRLAMFLAPVLRTVTSFRAVSLSSLFTGKGTVNSFCKYSIVTRGGKLS